MELSKEKKRLFENVRRRLGLSVRSVELDDETLCSLLEQCVGDYASYVQNFIIEANWAQLYGKNITNFSSQDIAFSLSMRTLEMGLDYADFFSKHVGLQSHGKFELKKDFFKIEAGKQVYVVPAGREINKVLWITPPTTDAAMWANYGGLGVPVGGGVVGQMPMGNAAVFGGINGAYNMGVGAYAIPAYDMALMAADLKYKQQWVRGDLVYKVTAGPDGTHLIHLMSTPGSRYHFGAGGGMSGMYGPGMINLKNCYCWYTYYDTTPDNVDECRKENQDVVLSPDQVPLEEMDFELFNAPTKNIVRQLLVGMAAETLAMIRGKFSGQIGMISSPLQMDYAQLMTYGNKERDRAMDELKERLARLSPYEIAKKNAELVKDLTESYKGVPLKFTIG